MAFDLGGELDADAQHRAHVQALARLQDERQLGRRLQHEEALEAQPQRLQREYREQILSHRLRNETDGAPELIEEVDRGDFVRRKIVITTAPHARMPVYLLIPKAGPLPLPVTVQLVNDANDTCFAAVYDMPDVQTNDANGFKAKK